MSGSCPTSGHDNVPLTHGRLIVRECPHIIRKSAGDETYDICEINTKGCLLEGGSECETWNEIREEWVAKGE